MKLQNEEDAIKQAIEAGYDPTKVHPSVRLPKQYLEEVKSFTIDGILSDPAFWQALGKARGWNYCKLHSFVGSNLDSERCNDCNHDGWLMHALRYFETRLSGGDLNRYWQNLP